MADSASILELVAALKHDLAKYVAWRSANFDDDAWSGELGDDFVTALRQDLLHTHGQEPAWAVWDRFAASLEDGWWAEELDEVREAVERLRGIEPALRQDDREAIAAARVVIRDAQISIRGRLRDLHRRLLGEGS